MRARNIKPGFFHNEELGDLPPIARLLYAGLWCIADREGRLEDRPERIKAQVLPYDMTCDIGALMDNLGDKGFILRYEVAGKRYVAIPKFAEHQRPHPNEAPSKLPAPIGDAETSNHGAPLVNHGAPLDRHSSTMVSPCRADILNPSSLNPSSPSPQGGESWQDAQPKPAAEVAKLWCDQYRGGKPFYKDVARITTLFEEWVQAGVATLAEIEEATKAKRDRSDSPEAFKFKFFKETKQPGRKVSAKEALADARERRKGARSV